MNEKYIMKECWTITEFDNASLGDYAKSLMIDETRKGVQTLCLIFAALLCAGAAVNFYFGGDHNFSDISIILAFLCLHVAIASRVIKETHVLHLLGLALLVVSSTAFVLLGHKAGAFGISMFAPIVLIFSVVPVVPWGLREASSVIVMNYAVFTISTLGVRSRFDTETLLMLQLFMVSTALISLALVGCNTSIRRKEIINRFELEEAHKKLYYQSRSDLLTGAWNRRYLKERFFEMALGFHKKQETFYFILFDLNDFKLLNDKYGHDFGDTVLQWISESFKQNFTKNGALIRMGGDEFAILTGSIPTIIIKSSIDALKGIIEKDGRISPSNVSSSFGIVPVPSETILSLRDLYKSADRALYAAKKNAGNSLVEGSLTSNTLNLIKLEG